jgi:hypothetical protein
MPVMGHRKGKDHLENLGVNRKIILKWTLKNCNGRVCTDLSGQG